MRGGLRRLIRKVGGGLSSGLKDGQKAAGLSKKSDKYEAVGGERLEIVESVSCDRYVAPRWP
jgi:hypothetical protein